MRAASTIAIDSADAMNIMNSHVRAGFDFIAFRRALGNFATGVTVMTASANGRRAGVTANSFNSVSLDPPLILWSIDKNSRSYEVFRDATHFAVNVLAADQIELSNRFARHREDKFESVQVEQAACGTPLLPDCAARFRCEQFQRLDGGDHWILIGKVVGFDDGGRAPLLYHQGAYSAVLPYPRLSRGEPPAAAGAYRGRLNDNLYYLMHQAVRRYQAGYRQRQLACGFHTNEARLLLALHGGRLDTAALLQLIEIPAREIDAVLEILRRKGLLDSDQDGVHRLTGAGMEQAGTLWRVADEQQAWVFSQFSAEQIVTFRQVLQQLCAAEPG